MGPAMGEADRRTCPGRRVQAGVAGSALDLQHAPAPVEDRLGMFPARSGGAGESDAGRSRAAPGALVASQDPEPAGLRLARARIQNRGSVLRGGATVPFGPSMKRRSERFSSAISACQAGRSSKAALPSRRFARPIAARPDLTPGGQGRAVRPDARAREELRLAIQMR